MSSSQVAIGLADKVINGLADGTLERIGGLIRDGVAKQFVGWLREAPGITEPVLSPLLSVTTAGALNLGISTMGFAVVINRLAKIERQLKRTQEFLSSVNYKIDLTFYANFQAALDLASSVFRMNNPETRKASMLQAINRFLEAERHYLSLVDIEIGNGSQAACDYIATLSLSYAVAARCYLELEEIETAEHHLREGLATLRHRYERHITGLLTSNPAAYLDPCLKNSVNLRRLTKVYQWFAPSLDEAAVFEMHRENLFGFNRNQSEWIKSLPPSIRLGVTVGPREMTQSGWKRLIGGQDWMPTTWSLPSLTEVLPRLSETIETIETMIEDERRFGTYITEVDQIKKTGMTFQQWDELSLQSRSLSLTAELLYIPAA